MNNFKKFEEKFCRIKINVYLCIPFPRGKEIKFIENIGRKVQASTEKTRNEELRIKIESVNSFGINIERDSG